MGTKTVNSWRKGLMASNDESNPANTIAELRERVGALQVSL